MTIAKDFEVGEWELTLRTKFICSETNTFDEYIAALERRVAFLKEMRGDGVEIEKGDADFDYARFTTSDFEVAKRFDMELVGRFEDEDGEDTEEWAESDPPWRAYNPTTYEIIATGQTFQEIQAKVGNQAYVAHQRPGG
jgi:hypothetical protein